jgi:cytochrome c oxidase subunit 2
MDLSSSRWRARVPCLLLLALVVVAGSALAQDPSAQFPQSTLYPRGDFARMVDDLFRKTLFWAVIVFVLVEGALLFVIFRFRGRPDDPEPRQVHGNTAVEVVWTIIPALVLAMIAVPTVKTIFRTYDLPKGSDVLQVEVIGHQFWWEFRYPQLGLVTANELHVPVGRPVALKMITRDVLHSFWVPQFAAKRDVFSNRTTTMYFTAEDPGLYPGQCAEFCGIQHGRMAFQVAASSPAEFDAWVGKMQATGAPPAPAAPADSTASTAAAPAGVSTASLAATAAPVDTLQGSQLFMMKGCIGCHSLNATREMGIGPNLAGIGARRMIAAGWLENTDANLARWIMDPQDVKKGSLMPDMGVTEAEAQALVAYLRQH